MLLLTGLSNTRWGALVLPFDLGLFGLSGCRLWTSVDFISYASAAAGASIGSLVIPNDSVLLGMSVYQQALALSAAAPNGLGAVSNGLELVIGGR